MTGERTTAEARATMIVVRGVADAYGSPVLRRPEEDPCSMCGCSLPAAEPGECDRPSCPLEGRGRP